MSDITSNTATSEPPHEPFKLTLGEAPLLISAPHAGSFIPHELHEQLTPRALESADTDWFMRELYEPIARQLGATLLTATASRYVIDLNRPRSDESLYPGQHTTGLCPHQSFAGEPLYLDARAEVSAEDKAWRVARFWDPYHAALQAQLNRLKAQHGQVLLWEAHSIKSVVPMLFEGRLPDVNLGTFEGRACAPALERALERRCEGALASSPWSYVLNGRFKGGYITRHYGAPAQGVHAIQLELSQRVYLEEEERPAWSEATQARSAEARGWIQGLISDALQALKEVA
jgi:N-formylglutamate deformylase